MKFRLVLSCTVLAGALTLCQVAFAQRARPARPPGPQTGEQAALMDLTGYWVSVVDEDWRFRMMTAPKGDYLDVPLNAAARKVADEFNPALYGGARYQISEIIDCRAYGAAGLMHMPARLHITWTSPNTLQIQTDWGVQTRVFHFIPGHPYQDAQQPLRAGGPANANYGAPSMQGYSVAAWEQPYYADSLAYKRGPYPGFGRGLGGSTGQPVPTGGDLVVVTSDLASGWLRRNGVPYGSQTRLVEHYLTFDDATGKQWFDVTTEVNDPEYLNAPFITTSDFAKGPDDSKWTPHPCKQVTEE